MVVVNSDSGQHLVSTWDGLSQLPVTCSSCLVSIPVACTCTSCIYSLIFFIDQSTRESFFPNFIACSTSRYRNCFKAINYIGETMTTETVQIMGNKSPPDVLPGLDECDWFRCHIIDLNRICLPPSYYCLSYLPIDSVTDSFTDSVYYLFLMYI
jgi:hypothetical protein